MYTSTGLDSGRVLNPKLLLQLLGGTKKPETEMIDNIFTKKVNVPGDKVTREIVTRTIRSIPYVGQNNPGVPLYGKSTSWDGITVPPLKAHHRIQAADFTRIKNLQGQEQRDAIAEEMVYVKNTIAWNMEWYARHFLTNGNCDYPFLVDGNAIADAIVYSLGTMTAVGAAPGTLFDAAGATLTDVIRHLDYMFKTGQDVPNRNHFPSEQQTITYAVTAVWNAIYDLLDGKMTTNVVSGRREGNDLFVGPYQIRKFDGAMVSPVDQSSSNAIPVKRMRMIDTSTQSPHTMASLEIENLKATGGQKYVFILPIEDYKGDYVDIMIQHRPVGLLIPEAMVDSLAVLT